MKKVFINQTQANYAWLQRTIRIMKLNAFLLIFTTLLVSANSFSQPQMLTMNYDQISLQHLFKEVENQTDYRFAYSRSSLNPTEKVTVHVNEEPIDNLLASVLDRNKQVYTIIDKYVVISDKDNYSALLMLQENMVTGKVVDASSGDPLPGVNVLIKGTTTGVITDFDGHYSISISDKNAVLVFSFLGYKTQNIPINNKTVINISLVQEVTGLDEVVVVGYGTMKKSDLTGAITQMNAEDITAVSTSNPVQALQGRSAGVSVMTNNAPGESPTLRIRGSGSISAGNDPLYVVDGFPLMDADLSDINPNDIKSMEILKDASATAIYGSRGANGVVLITTKSGNKGKYKLSFSTYMGVQAPSRVVEMLGRDEFIDFINEAYTYSTGSPVYSSSGIVAPDYDTDWQDEIINDAATVQEHSFSFSGGNDRTMYLLSGSYHSQEGLVDASGFEKYTVRTNISNDFNKWLKVGTHLQISRTNQDIRENPTGNIFRYGWPTCPVKNEDGSWYYSVDDPDISSYFEGRWNPASNADEVTDEMKKDRILGDVYAEITFGEHLKFKTNFGVDIANKKGYNYSTTESVGGQNSGGYGVGGQSYYTTISKLTENILTYSNVWNDKHRFSATGVYSYQDYSYESLEIDGSGFTNDETGAYDMSLADESSVTYSSNKYSNKLVSFTSRLTYSYDARYMLTATGRYDGSSRFGENNKWGFFPSFGVGWRVNNEAFMENLKDQITNLKIRASYGVTGNQEIGNYNSLAQLSSVYYSYNDEQIIGYTESIGNPDLQWERTAQIDIGVDLSLWNRIDLAFDYYKRNTTDLLYEVPIPTTSGYSSMLENIGEVENTGFEISAHARILDGPLKWDVSLNFSKNQNEVIELYNDVEEVNIGTSENGMAKYLKVGDPVTGIWSRESAGIIKTDEQLAEYQVIRSAAQLGEEMYVDHTGDSSITSEDYICLGSTVPEKFYGFSTSLAYKNFSLEIYGQGAFDYASQASINNNSYGDDAIGYASSTESYLIYGENQLLNVVYLPTKYARDDMWSEDNPDGDFPRAGAQGSYVSDRTNADWHYFILKNIIFSYDFSGLMGNVNWIESAKFYINMQNFVAASNQRGYNPENGDVSYPWARTTIFGIKANF